MKYDFNLTMNPSFAILASEEQFVYIESRVGQVTDFEKDAVVRHVNFLDNLKKKRGFKGYLQLRRLFFDDKSGTFNCVVDYLTDSSIEQKPELSIGKDFEICPGQSTYFDLEIIKCSFTSDHFASNHRDFYKTERVIPSNNDFDNYLLTRNLEDIKRNNLL